MLSHLKEQLEEIVLQCLQQLYPSQADRSLIQIDIPSDKQHGEFSTNIAMRLARDLKQNPVSIASAMVKSLREKITQGSLEEKIADIEIKKPGFINFFLTHKAMFDILYEIFEQKEDYGRLDIGKGEKVQIEFVSANPTGPLSVAHARQAAVGDALANIMDALGYKVTREFYVNDEGNQINLLGASVRIRAQNELLQRPIPEAILEAHHYQGDYIIDIAKQFIKDYKINKPDQLVEEEKKGAITQYAVKYLLDVIKQELADFNVHFDVWSYQSEIATTKKIDETITELGKKDFIKHEDGALWFKSTTFGDDKDRVVKKSDGTFTYLAPDIVYHKDKYERGFKKIINIWGPDHHGYIPRLKAAVQALGQDPNSLDILIVQLATIYKEAKPLSMSTRRGEYIKLRDVINDVGVDAARFFFLMRRLEAHLDFDLELAKKESPENPVYYIQYAHARINSIIKFAGESGIKPKYSKMGLLKEPEEMDLIKLMGSFPDILVLCVKQLDPFSLVTYLQELATCFHKFYDRHRVVGDDKKLSGERLALIDAVRIVLADGLKLLGVSAPEKM